MGGQVSTSSPHGDGRLVCGIDIGGTRTKVGLVDAANPSAVLSMEVFDTERGSEELFLDNIRKSVHRLSEKAGTPSRRGSP
jgi:predicted NBD/HSP70 family sugar kinase